MNAPNRSLFDRLQRVIETEVRGFAMTLPREDVKPVGPHDGDSEQVVLSALLCGHATIEDVKPLEARHFYSTFNARLFGVLCTSAERELPALIDLLDMRGPVLEELTLIRDASPFVCVPLLSVEVAKILDRWLERELIRVMQELDAQLRVGAITHDGARARLRQHFMENAG